MKKLMIAAAIVCAAAFVQAATVSWMVSNVYTPTAGTGVYSDTKVGSAATFAVYLVTDTVFNNTAVADIYQYVQDNKLTASYSGATSMSSKTLTSGDTYAKGDNVYALQLITYTDGDGKDWYVANKSFVTIAEAAGEAQDATVSLLNTKVSGGTDAQSWTGSGGAITGWTAAPEPTSGLLLLLGMAGLALRRRRA